MAGAAGDALVPGAVAVGAVVPGAVSPAVVGLAVGAAAGVEEPVAAGGGVVAGDTPDAAAG
ncbi:MAG: hypothetical protein AB7F89_25365, partial [Pirellulaceae bacterium]